MKTRLLAPLFALSILISHFSLAGQNEYLETLVHNNLLQEASWYAEHIKDHARSIHLRSQLEEKMSHEDFEYELFSKLGTASDKFKIKYKEGTIGLFKPDLRMDPAAIRTEENKDIYEAAFSNSRSSVSRSAGEIVAYRLDRLIPGLDIVPVTVRLKVKGITGSVQYWVPQALTGHKKDEGAYFAKIKFLDFLLQNGDRNKEQNKNWMSVEFDGEMNHAINKIFAIDHGCAFDTEYSIPFDYFGSIGYFDDDLKKEILRLVDTDVQNSLHDLLTPNELRDLIARIHHVKALLKAMN